MTQRRRRRGIRAAATALLMLAVGLTVGSSPARADVSDFYCDDGVSSSSTDSTSVFYAVGSECYDVFWYYNDPTRTGCSATHGDLPYGRLDTIRVFCDGAIPPPPPYGSTADLTVQMEKLTPSIAGPLTTNGGSFQVAARVKNFGLSKTASLVRVPLSLSGLTVVTATPEAGSYSSGTWSVGSLAPGAEKQLLLWVKTSTGTGVKTGTITATVSSSTTDPKSTNNKSPITGVTNSGPYGKTGVACTGGTLFDRTYTAEIDADGRRTDGLWRWIRTPIARVTMTWTGLCRASDGRLLNAGNYQVSVTGLNQWSGAWTVVSTGAAECQGDHTVRYCRRTVVLRESPTFNFSATTAAGLGANLNAGVVSEMLRLTGSANFNLNVDGTWSPTTRELRLPITMGIRMGGCTWAAGGGNSALPDTCGR